MNRTPRSASRRAIRQFAANVPGFLESGPYSSKVCSDSFDRSVNSGTDVCMRNAISYCAMRVLISGLFTVSNSSWFSFARSSMNRARCDLSKPAGSDTYSTGSPTDRSLIP